MVDLDIRTLALLAVLISFLMAGAMVVVWLLNPNERSARYWALGNISTALGFLLIGLRGVVPPFFSIPLANTLITLGYSLILVGVSLFVGRKPMWGWKLLSVLAVFFSFLYFTYWEPSVAARIVIVSMIVSILSLQAAYQLMVEPAAHMRSVQTLTGAVLVIHATYMAFRSGYTLLDQPLKSLFSGNLVQSLAFLDVIIAAICLTYGFAAMINRRLQFNLHHLAHHDYLTGVFNRQAFEEAVGRELARCQRRQQPLSILLLDLDHFKQVNDRYGHAIGDQLLKDITKVLTRVLRQEDILGRIGGEEFALLLPETDSREAANVAERVREAVADSRTLSTNGEIQITTSVGTATSQVTSDGWEQLFNRADKALYRAKAEGRNRVFSGEAAVATA